MQRDTHLGGPRKLSTGLLLLTGVAMLLLGAGCQAATAAPAAGQTGAPAAAPGQAATLVKTSIAGDGRADAALVYSGEVRAATQVSVLPKATGRVERLPVEVGTRVKKGDVIAELEATSLKTQVAQAQANLEVAQAKLSSLEAGARSEQVAQARANLESARARLAGMSGGREEQIAQAQAALETAWANRERVKKGATEADRQAAESAVSSAEANLQTARARLETVKKGPTQSEWGQALGAVDSARANLAAAQIRLYDAQQGPKEDVIKAAEAAVVAAKAQVAAIGDLRDLYDDRDSSATAAASAAAAGATSSERISRQEASAQAALEAAQAKLDLLRRSPLPADIQQLQAAVDAAKAGVLSAEYRVEQMKRGVTPEDMQQAQASVAAAEAGLESARARVKQIDGGATSEDLWVVDSAVKQAEQALALAQKPYRDEDVTQAQAAVTAAEQSVLLAQSPYTQWDLAMARATARQADAAMQLAQIALSEAVVVSPVDGVVADRLLSVGAMATPQTVIATVVSDSVEVAVNVEESKVWLLNDGQQVEVGATAYPGTTFPARVSSIAPTADPKSRSFLVKVEPQDPQRKLRPGMFAQVKVAPEADAKSSLVPRDAVVNRSGESLLFVVKGDTVQARKVSVEMGQNGTARVTAGLEVGEEVVTYGQTDLKDGDRIRKS